MYCRLQYDGNSGNLQSVIFLWLDSFEVVIVYLNGIWCSKQKRFYKTLIHSFGHITVFVFVT